MIDVRTQKMIDTLCELECVTPEDVIYALGAYEAAKPQPLASWTEGEIMDGLLIVREDNTVDVLRSVDLVERVAEAIFLADHPTHDWKECGEEYARGVRKQAKAAIAAMEEKP